MTLKEYNKLATDKKIKDWVAKGPGFEAYMVVKVSLKESSSNELTKAIMHFITFIGGFAERVNTTGTYRKGKVVENCLGQKYTIGGGYTYSGSTKGSADIHALIQGKTCMIEVKFQKDKMSEAQIKYKENIEKAGGVYIVAKNFDQATTQIINQFNIQI